MWGQAATAVIDDDAPGVPPAPLESSMPANPSRRTVLSAAAWTAPVVAVASVVPPAAATSQDVTTEVVYIAPSPEAPQGRERGPLNVGSYSPGTLRINDIRVVFGKNLWNPPFDWGSTPSQAQVPWQIEVLDSAGTVVHRLDRLATLAGEGSDQVTGYDITGLNPGPYTVRVTITSIEFLPNPVNGETFTQTVPVTASRTLTVLG